MIDSHPRRQLPKDRSMVIPWKAKLIMLMAMQLRPRTSTLSFHRKIQRWRSEYTKTHPRNSHV
jgi:hypothetical protein